MNVGDTVYGSFGQYGAVDVKAGKVTKVSPTGQVTVDFQERWGGNDTPRLRRFSDAGREIGGAGGLYSGKGHLIDEAAYTRLAEKQRAADALRAVTNHLRSWSFKNKADLNKFVKRLNELAARVPDDGSSARDRDATLAETPSAPAEGSQPGPQGIARKDHL